MTNRYTQTWSWRPVIKFPYFCDFRVIACYIFITLIVSSQLASGVYLNEIAVHVQGGRSVADRIAKRHGFINRGQIGNLENHYLLEHPNIHKRSASPSHVHHARLSQEPEILWFEQQFVKKRVKRDLTFTDPLWNKQWYLHNGGRRGRNGPGGFDMGVAGAWKMGYTGRGVVITILDDGIERDHPDLIENYDPYASTDINNHDSDPMPRYDFSNENRHGTRCAGEVAAKANNSNCIVGVAYNSGIGGVRMLDGNVYDKVEADSLSHNHTHVDIYSASWGPDDDGRVVDGPGPLAKKSFIQGIKTGRGKKGNIFMWASGNGGRAEDSCSCDGYTNSIYTLSISSTSQHGGKPWYLEECSSTLATTYSSGAPDERQIITTDLRKRCTETHTGTSASAPLAAGLVALALEANPSLTWRDVQYITLLSANPEPMADGQWRVNGMNRKVSLRYGYGLMNATQMVYLAERWTTVPEQHICTIAGTKKNVPLYKYTMFENQITTDGCAGNAQEVRYLEHVHVRITLNYKRRGDLSINLVSPSGTNSTLLPKRNRDMSDGGFKNWEFLSVHFWEENPAGSWTLVIVDQINPYAGNDQQGTLVNWSLVLYGTKEKPVILKETPSPVTPTYTCHSECVDTCTGPNPEDCTRCRHYRIEDGPCVEQCPTAYRADRDLCVPCSVNCQYCVTVPGSREHCRQCKGGLFSIENEGSCVTSCPAGYFRVGTSTVCRKCSQQCELCEGTSSHCLSCVAGMVLKDNKCVLPPTLCPEDVSTTTTNTVSTATNTQTTPISDASTTVVPASTPATRSDIECLTNSISLHIPLGLLPTGQQVTWQDPSCVVADNGTHLVGTIGLGDCGTYVVFNSSHVTFENELVSSAGSTSTTTSGIDYGSESNSVIVVQCVYPRRETGSTAFRPVQGHVRFFEKTIGHMQVHMRQARDATFADIYPSQTEPREVHLNDKLYIKLTADQGSPVKVAINVDRCLATPSPSPLDTEYQELTNNGCPAIPSVSIHNSSSSEVHLSFRAFQFRSHPGAPVYVHCEVYVCPLSHPQCVAGCTNIAAARTRRAALSDVKSHLVSTGPFPVTNEKEQGAFGGQSIALIAVTGLCACLAVVATVFGILAWKGMRRQAKEIN